MELLEGIESDGWTVIKFQRQIASCEPEYDLSITVSKKKWVYFSILQYIYNTTQAQFGVYVIVLFNSSETTELTKMKLGTINHHPGMSVIRGFATS